MIKVKLSWCPLVWMFWFKTSGNAINKTNERLLGLPKNIDSFAELLANPHDITNDPYNIHADEFRTLPNI